LTSSLFPFHSVNEHDDISDVALADWHFSFKKQREQWAWRVGPFHERVRVGIASMKIMAVVVMEEVG
jgi:hypothetical protein